LGQLKGQTLFENISAIKDPRIERHKRYLLVDILVIAICAMICAAETWEILRNLDTQNENGEPHSWS